jgi:CBS-domain-containing membrane protein
LPRFAATYAFSLFLSSSHHLSVRPSFFVKNMPALLAEDLLNEMIPPLKGTDSAGKAARWLDEFHVAQLPVLDNRQYRGLVTEADLADFDDPETLLSELPLRYGEAYVRSDQHFYRVMELAIENKIQLVPVVDERHEYAGVVTIADALAAFGHHRPHHGGAGLFPHANQPLRRRKQRQNH